MRRLPDYELVATVFRPYVKIQLVERIDLEIVFGILKKHLNDFDLFASEINTFISKQL